MQRVVVFKDPAEFEHLKQLFYGSYQDQKRALGLTRAYQVRGHLPASIHLTSLVVAAIHNDVPQNDLYAIRQTYAMAIIRLVNEILDSVQSGRVAAPLHALARDLKLPSSFVELRHAATHEELPTIYLLRDMGRRAMDWLWDAYWAKNRPKRAERETPPAPASSDDIKNFFRDWRRARRGDVAADIDGQAQKLVEALAKVPVDAVVEVVVKRNILVPAGSSASSVIPLWGPLFTALGPAFVGGLVERLLALRNRTEWPSFETTPQNAAYDLWLAYLVPHAPDAVSLLSELPRPWNAVLLATIANAQAAPAVYTLAEEMAAVTGASLAPYEPQPGNPPPIVHDYPNGPWKRAKNWTPRPLGTI